jgi:hypothetical protein
MNESIKISISFDGLFLRLLLMCMFFPGVIHVCNTGSNNYGRVPPLIDALVIVAWLNKNEK